MYNILISKYQNSNLSYISYKKKFNCLARLAVTKNQHRLFYQKIENHTF